MKSPVPCPNCQSRNVYKTKKPVGVWRRPRAQLPARTRSLVPRGRFDIVVCRDCGLTRFFVQQEDRDDLDDSSKWERVS